MTWFPETPQIYALQDRIRDLEAQLRLYRASPHDPTTGLIGSDPVELLLPDLPPQVALAQVAGARIGPGNQDQIHSVVWCRPTPDQEYRAAYYASRQIFAEQPKRTADIMAKMHEKLCRQIARDIEEGSNWPFKEAGE